jgi:hypothetical protein
MGYLCGLINQILFIFVFKKIAEIKNISYMPLNNRHKYTTTPSKAGYLRQIGGHARWVKSEIEKAKRPIPFGSKN